MDDMGKIVGEVKTASKLGSSAGGLTNPAYHFQWIGLEAGPLPQRAL